MNENFYYINFVFVFGIIFVLIKIFEKIKKRNSNQSGQNKSINNSDISKYKNLIASLSVIDEILVEKIKLGKAGALVDLNTMLYQMKVLPILESGNLSIFGQSFIVDLMEILDEYELNSNSLNKIENLSKYIKNEIIKLKKLI